MTRFQAYTRIGFGLLIAFGMVGNCAGKTEMSLIVFVMTTMVWAATRIVIEAGEALIELRAKKKSGDDDKDGGQTPPTAPA